MKALMNGCAAAVLLAGLGFQAHAQSAAADAPVREAPVHAVPADDDDDLPAIAPPAEAAPPKIEARAEAPAEPAQVARAEPAVVKALVEPKAPAAPALTPDESQFFAALGQRVTNAASAYETYVRRAGAIDPAFASAGSVQRAVKASAAYQPQQLEEGIVAYAALVALRNQAFVEGVRAISNPAFADGLAANPERVMQVRGASEAAADVAGVLRAQGAALTAAGKAVTKAAYDIQAQAWSKAPVADPKGVLDAAKLSAGQARAATTPSKQKLLASLVAAPQTEGEARAAAPDVVRGLALAAMAIQGKTGDGKEAAFEALLRDPASAECLKMAKLNLNQCLAVAGPNYEDVYCAGRHAVSDTAKCVTAAAGDAAVQEPAAPAPRLQTAEAYGPEQAAAYGRAAPAVSDLDEDEDEAAPPPAPAPRRYTESRRAEPMPDPRAAPAPAPYAAPAQPYDYAQNDYRQARPYAAPQPPAGYDQRDYAPPAQPSYTQRPYAQSYPQPYAGSPYAPQPYAGQGYYERPYRGNGYR